MSMSFILFILGKDNDSISLNTNIYGHSSKTVEKDAFVMVTVPNVSIKNKTKSNNL